MTHCTLLNDMIDFVLCITQSHPDSRTWIEQIKRISTDFVYSSEEPLPKAAHPTPSQAAISKERLELLTEVLETFPDVQRQVLVMRLRDELGYEEIGRLIGKSTEATRVLYGRSLKKLIDVMLKEN